MKMRKTILHLVVFTGCLILLSACGSNQNKEDAAVKPVDMSEVPTVKYLDPIVIKKGGTYTGNYKSLDSQVPAVWVQTNEPVEITGCIIVSTGDMIKCNGGTNVKIHHNSLYGLFPLKNDQWGRALNDYQPQSMTFENNLVEHSGGILVDHTDSFATSVVIRYNIIRNTDKRRANTAAGENRAGVLFNSVTKIAGEISWNQFVNIPDSSFVEDNINLFNSGGKSGAPYLVHDNYIKGAYPFPLNATSYVGSGITVDGDPGSKTMETMSQFINVYKNQVISTCNAAMNLAAGHDIHFYDNTMISCGLYPDGTQSERFWGGCCIWNASNVPVANFINNTIKHNTIGYVRGDKSIPLPGRQDWVVIKESPISVEPGDNISLPNPITLETEKAEWPKWQKKVAANKVNIGNSGNATASVTTPPAK
jgi:hypothetical protein